MARRRMLAPINSVKHFVQHFLTTIVGASVVNLTLVDAVVASAVDTPEEVLEGSVIKAVWVEIWVIGQGAEGVTSAFGVSLEKLPAAATPMTSAQSLALMTYPNKKNILYTTQGVVGSDIGANAVPILRQWFAIPKGKQRFGLGDKLVLNLANVGPTNYQSCGVFIFKEYK